MILRMRPGTPAERVHTLRARLEGEGLRTALSSEPARPIVAVLDKLPQALLAELERAEEVEAVVRPAGSWRRVDRSFRDATSVAHVGQVKIGGAARRAPRPEAFERDGGCLR